MAKDTGRRTYRSGTPKKTSFIREWAPFIIFILILLFARIFLWSTARVDGNSMDPTLGDGQRLIYLTKFTPKRFEIVIAKENQAQSGSASGKVIVKRVIGMPGDTIKFDHDTLSIKAAGSSSFVDYSEPYLDNYKSLFASGKLANTYLNLPLRSDPNNLLDSTTRQQWANLAKESKAFTTLALPNYITAWTQANIKGSPGSPTFEYTVPSGQYFLMGDDRVVSSDSRSVGPFDRSQLLGHAVLRFWPLNKVSLF